MKTNIFKRNMALFLAFPLCFTTLIGSALTPAFAAGTKAEAAVLGFLRDGDNLYRTGTWGHEAMTYMNGWTNLRSKQTIVRAAGSLVGLICYCIEPGVPINTGDKLTDHDESFWDNYPSNLNSAISPDDIKLFIDRIMQYGYTGTVSMYWYTQNEGGDKLAHATATQLLIWETITVGRDTDFNKVSPRSCDAVLDQTSTGHPLRDKIMSCYNSIVANVQAHFKLPSFFARNTGKAQEIELIWDGSRGSATLTDANNVLSNCTFTANVPRVHCTVNSNQLTISSKTSTDGLVTITAGKSNFQRRGLVTWTDDHIGPDGELQDLVTYTQSATGPIQDFAV